MAAAIITPELLEVARFGCRNAFLVYGKESAALINEKNGTNFRIIEKKNIRILTEESETRQRVTVAGTDDFWDWWANVKAWPVRRTGIGMLHDGVADLCAQVNDEIEAFLNPEKELEVFGHSQAAGTMGVIAIHAAKRGQKIVAAHTYGGMLWCDGEVCDLVAALGIPLHNWIVGWDRVPFQPSLLGYHFGRKRPGVAHFLGLDGTVLEGAPSLWAGKPWRTWTHRKLNHSLETYGAALAGVRL